MCGAVDHCASTRNVPPLRERPSTANPGPRQDDARSAATPDGTRRPSRPPMPTATSPRRPRPWKPTPTTWPPLQRRARAYSRKSQHAEALADYTKATQLRPADANLQVGRGGSALQPAPVRAGAGRLRRGDPARRQQRWPPATAAATPIARSSATRRRSPISTTSSRCGPTFVFAFYNRGLTNVDMGRAEDATRDFTVGTRPRQGLRRCLHAARPAAREGRRARAGHRRLPGRDRRSGCQVRERPLGAARGARAAEGAGRRGALSAARAGAGSCSDLQTVDVIPADRFVRFWRAALAARPPQS